MSTHRRPFGLPYFRTHDGKCFLIKYLLTKSRRHLPQANDFTSWYGSFGGWAYSGVTIPHTSVGVGFSGSRYSCCHVELAGSGVIVDCAGGEIPYPGSPEKGVGSCGDVSLCPYVESPYCKLRIYVSVVFYISYTWTFYGPRYSLFLGHSPIP